jgi:hypothetical protein
MASKKKNHAMAEVHAGAWKLPKNDIWSIPPDVGEVRFVHDESAHMGFGGELRRVTRRLTGLAITRDGRVFGKRTLMSPKESGYQLEGRVSIGGTKYRAFTSSRLFEREDGSLCDVGVLIVCGYKPVECKFYKAERIEKETGKPTTFFLPEDPAPGELDDPCGECDACDAATS